MLSQTQDVLNARAKRWIKDGMRVNQATPKLHEVEADDLHTWQLTQLSVFRDVDLDAIDWHRRAVLRIEVRHPFDERPCSGRRLQNALEVSVFELCPCFLGQGQGRWIKLKIVHYMLR